MTRPSSTLIIFILIITILIPTSSLTLGEENNNNINQTKQLSIESYDGYTLFTPEFTTKTLLINNDGETIHSWESENIQGLPVYLLENGHLIRGCSLLRNPRFIAGGVTGRVEMHDWNNTLIWEFDYSTNNHCLHHDIEVLPNGNILMTAWEYKTAAEAISAGRNPNNIQNQQLWPDTIIEVEPTSSTTGNIVWEWHVWDHLIQDFDSTRENYGIIADHPELIDINSGGRQSDLNHINSVDYNEELDQILLSSHNQNEIWIIDHSTTTEEAAGHTGGRYGRGGDLLYRWGNPRIYEQGDSADQQLFGQHDAQWIKSGCPGEGNILIFNNGQNRPEGKYTSIVEIEPPLQNNGSYQYNPESAFLPIEPIWVYTDTPPTNFFASKVSGAQRLPNGNTLICSGDEGYFFEVTLEGEKVWDFQNIYPLFGKKNVFKIQRYGLNYSGLGFLSNHPNKPSTPTGTLTGIIDKEYCYSCYATDPNDDDLYYLFDWGDGTNSDWIGPIKSGKNINVTHIWASKGDYSIQVKAKDTHGLESEWSDPLTIEMPKKYAFTFPRIFKNHYFFSFIALLLRK